MTALTWFDRVCRVSSTILLGFGCVAVVLMALHVSYDVLGRSLAKAGIYGTTEIVSFYYMVAAVCLPLAHIELRDEHITVDVFYGYLPGALKSAVMAFSIACTAAFFATFSYRSWQDALAAFATGETLMGYAEIPIWPARFFLPVSFAFVVVACMLRLARVFLPPPDADVAATPTELLGDQTAARSLRA
ncbi:MAG: TRAP transporter small permease [Alphaproteobacteria bacterium]|nr:TRAP transporter small permease [Alphaproteobacteria bacterium]